MILSKEVNSTIRNVCNLLNSAIYAGYPTDPFIRANTDDLVFILDHVVDELSRFRGIELSERSVEAAVNERDQKVRLLAPLARFESVLKRAICTSEEQRKDIILELSDMSTDYRVKAEKQFSTKSKATEKIKGPERTLLARQSARKEKKQKARSS